MKNMANAVLANIKQFSPARSQYFLLINQSIKGSLTIPLMKTLEDD